MYLHSHPPTHPHPCATILTSDLAGSAYTMGKSTMMPLHHHHPMSLCHLATDLESNQDEGRKTPECSTPNTRMASAAHPSRRNSGKPLDHYKEVVVAK